MNKLGEIAVRDVFRGNTKRPQSYTFSQVAITSICRTAKVSPHMWTHDLPYAQQLVALISSGLMTALRQKQNT